MHQDQNFEKKREGGGGGGALKITDILIADTVHVRLALVSFCVPV